MKSHPESPEIKKYEKLRSWWLWMFCEWFPLQLHFRYRRVRLPSVRDASLTDGLANGANEMEGMLGGPEGRCQTEQGSLPSSQETAGNPMSWEANRERLNAFHYFKTFQYLFCYTVLGILARLTFGLHRLQVRPRRVPELRPVAPVRLVGLVGKCHFVDMSSRWISDFLSPIWRTKSPCLKISIPLWSLQQPWHDVAQVDTSSSWGCPKGHLPHVGFHGRCHQDPQKTNLTLVII